MRWGAVPLFFFSRRRRHTRSLCDWSSDVCSSDLWKPRTRHGRRLERTDPRAIARGGEAAPRRHPRPPRQQRTRALLAPSGPVEAAAGTARSTDRRPRLAPVLARLHPLPAVSGRAASGCAADDRGVGRVATGDGAHPRPSHEHPRERLCELTREVLVMIVPSPLHLLKGCFCGGGQRCAQTAQLARTMAGRFREHFPQVVRIGGSVDVLEHETTKGGVPVSESRQLMDRYPTSRQHLHYSFGVAFSQESVIALWCVGPV